MFKNTFFDLSYNLSFCVSVWCMRRAVVLFIMLLSFVKVPAVSPLDIIEQDSVARDTVLIVAVPVTEYHPYGFVKSNMPAWLIAQANVAVEFDVASHWSVNIPIYYSGMNHFIGKWKFRVFGFQPAVRYWISEDNQGWFVGFHPGIAWYNYAFGGDYRYQDKGRHTPAIGAGLSAGYRLPVSANRRWWLEAELGLGVYSLNYDRFVNEKNGARVDSRKKTAFMPDIISLTIAYRFDMVKGGER